MDNIKDGHMRVLSIDAWNYGDEENEYCWQWNAWYNVGDITKQEFERIEREEGFITWFIGQGYVMNYPDRLEIDDDQHNIVIQDKETSEPLFAIEYGNCY